MEGEPLYLYLRPEALEAQALDLFGIHEPDDSFAAASVWDLRLGAQRQRRLLELDRRGALPLDRPG